tara:strand:- start:4458 stop:4721 length:264 start_codon:yes stop_codon:yes gene_type:complete
LKRLGKPAVIRDSEIEGIKSFLGEFPLSELVSEHFEIGNQVRVDSGALSGQSGIIRKTQGNKALLFIASLGIELHAEISLNHLKRVG